MLALPEHTHTSTQCMQGQPDSTHLDEKFAGAKDKARICVPNASGKLAKRARIAGVRVCPKKHFSCNGPLRMSVLLHRICSYFRYLDHFNCKADANRVKPCLSAATQSSSTEVLKHLATGPHCAVVL